jgi:ribosomal protein S17
VKNTAKQAKHPVADKSPERLKRLKALDKRIRGKFKDFMTQKDLRKMREDKKWQTATEKDARFKLL